MNSHRKPISNEELAERLSQQTRVEPPADLLERLLADLPVAPAVLPAPANDPGRPASRRWHHFSALAAGLAVLVGGGLVARRVLEHNRSVAPIAASERRLDERAANGSSVADQRERSRPPVTQSTPPLEPENVLTGRPEPAQPESPAAPQLEEPLAKVAEPRPARPRALIERRDVLPSADPVGRAVPEAEKVRAPVNPASPRRVSGIARDAESGAPLPGVTVTAASPNISGVRAAISDHSGAFELPPVPFGDYDITAELDGYQTLTAKVDLSSRESAELDFAMPLGVISESLMVTSSAGESISESSTVSTTISYEANHPKPRSIGSEARRAQSAPAPPPPAVGRVATTGGTTEPNDQPYGDVFVASSGINPFIASEDDPLSTFALEVDTGSWSVARAWLERGQLPPSELIRVEEALNSYSYGDTSPKRADFALTIEGAPSPWPGGARRQLLRIGLTARELDRGERRPVVLVVLVDVSGSMEQGGRLELVKGALAILLERLRPGDRVGLVTYSDSAQTLLDPTADLAVARQAISRLRPQGSTNAEAGLRRAYGLAEQWLGRGSDVRVLLCSDGVANVGATGPDSILESLGRWNDRGIELTAVGVGLGNYNDVLLEQLANRANGRYAYVDDLREAERIFGDSLDGTLSTLAHDARAQVQFDPRQVDRWRLIGYENRAMPDSAFRDDRRDAGEIGFGHRVTALYELVLASSSNRRIPLGEVRLRWRPRGETDFVEVAEQIRSEDLAQTFERARPSLRLAAAVAGFAEVLRGSPWVAGLELNEVASWIEQLPRDVRSSEEVRRLVELVRIARQLGARAPEGDFGRRPAEPTEDDVEPTRRRPPMERGGDG